MSEAFQIYYSGFDAAFYKLPPRIHSRIEGRIDDDLGLRLKSFPHHHLEGHNRFRLRVGDYRIIYTFRQNCCTFPTGGLTVELFFGTEDK